MSIVDPELMLTIPKSVTASTGIDVFFHAMEAYLSTAATPFSDMCALTAMEITANALGKVLEDGCNIEMRSQMAWASTLGGFSIFQTNGAIGIHALGQVLSGLTDVEHGRSLCAVAPAYIRYTWEGDIHRYANVSRILGADPGLSDKKAAEITADLLWDLLKQYNLDCTLQSLGLIDADSDKIVEDAYRASGVAFEKTLKKLTREDVKKIVKEAFKY